MNKGEFIKASMEKADALNKNLTKRQLEDAFEVFQDVHIDTLKAGEKIQFVGYYTMEPHGRAERKGFNPQSKEEIEIPAKVVPKITPGSKLEDAVAELPVENYLKSKK